MNIKDASILMTDLASFANRSGEQAARDMLAKMIRETVSGQMWGVAVPTVFLTDTTLPKGLEVKDFEGTGISAITGTVTE